MDHIELPHCFRFGDSPQYIPATITKDKQCAGKHIYIGTFAPTASCKAIGPDSTAYVPIWNGRKYRLGMQGSSEAPQQRRTNYKSQLWVGYLYGWSPASLCMAVRHLVFYSGGNGEHPSFAKLCRVYQDGNRDKMVHVTFLCPPGGISTPSRWFACLL